MRYFWIGSNSDPLKFESTELFEKQRICRKCGMPFDGDAIDIRLSTLPKGEAFAWTLSTSICALHRSFCDRLGFPDTFSDHSIGRVFNSKGEQVSDYVTVNAYERCFLRGSWAPRIGPSCSLCDRFFAYTPQGGPQYILEKDIGKNKNIVFLQGTTFLVSSDLIEKTDLRKFKSIVIEDASVQVLETARDGFANDAYPKISFPRA